MTETVETVITTPYSRELTVFHNVGGIFLKLDETNNTKPYVQAFLSHENAKAVATALLEAVGENTPTDPLLTDLPEVTESNIYLDAGTYYQPKGTAPDDVAAHIKALVAIHRELVKRAEAKAEAAAEKADAETALNKRRDELSKELSGDYDRTYSICSYALRSAIDKIMALEGRAVGV